MRSRPWLSPTLGVGILFALVLAASPALALVNGTWSSVGGSGPPARKGHTAIYDSNAKRALVFGGEGHTLHGGSTVDTLFDDVWSLDLSCEVPTWTQLTVSGTPPKRREDHSAIYDPAGNRMIVFGGEGHTFHGTTEVDTLFNDTWSLSLTGTPTWSQLSPSGTLPCRRSGQSAIYDPNAGTMIIFGGLVPFGISTIETQGAFVLALGGGTSWSADVCNEGSDCIPINGHICTDRPSPRQYQSMIWDGGNNRGVVFAGWYEDEAFNDTWKRTPTWSSLTTSGTVPGQRENHRTVYDSARSRMVMFGGDDGNTNNYDEVWELSLPIGGTPTWGQLSPSGTGPGGLTFSTMVYDPVRDRCVVFGGIDNGGGIVGTTSLLTFGTDGIAPGTTSDLYINAILGHNVRLRWTAPGDDGASCGTATSYSVRKLSGSPITSANWNSATALSSPPTPHAAGVIDSMWTGNLSTGVFWYFALRTTDENGNVSDVSNNDCIKWSGSTIQLCSDDPGHAVIPRAEVGPAFAIDRLTPNPARREVSVAFTLPGVERARIELIDVAGRAVLSRDLGAPGPGPHVIDLGAETRLRAGFYVVRVTYARERLMRSLVVVD